MTAKNRFDELVRKIGDLIPNGSIDDDIKNRVGHADHLTTAQKQKVLTNLAEIKIRQARVAVTMITAASVDLVMWTQIAFSPLIRTTLNAPELFWIIGTQTVGMLTIRTTPHRTHRNMAGWILFTTGIAMAFRYTLNQ